MPKVRLTKHLKRFFPGLETHLMAEGGTVSEVITSLNTQFPGLAAYIIDERGALRKHVNIFVGQDRIRDRQNLSDPVAADEQVHILQALSGG